MPSVTELIRDVLDNEPLYRLLSAVAHGHHWAIQKLCFTLVPSVDAASPISGITLRGVTKESNTLAMAMLVLESAVALARTTWYHGLYLGWDRDSLIAPLEGHFDRLNSTESMRFWRAAT
jgi:hypothetical protein